MFDFESSEMERLTMMLHVVLEQGGLNGALNLPSYVIKRFHQTSKLYLIKWLLDQLYYMGRSKTCTSKR